MKFRNLSFLLALGLSACLDWSLPPNSDEDGEGVGAEGASSGLGGVARDVTESSGMGGGRKSFGKSGGASSALSGGNTGAEVRDSGGASPIGGTSSGGGTSTGGIETGGGGLGLGGSEPPLDPELLCQRHADCSDEVPTCVDGVCSPFDCEAPEDPPLEDELYVPTPTLTRVETEGTRVWGRVMPLGWWDFSALDVCIVPGEGALDGSGGICVVTDEYNAFDFGLVTEFPVPFYLRVSHPDFYPTLRSVLFDPQESKSLGLGFTYVATREQTRDGTCTVDRHLNPENGQVYVVVYQAETSVLDASNWVPLEGAEVLAVGGLRGGKAAYWNTAQDPDPSLERTSKTGVWLAGDVSPGQLELRVTHPDRVCDKAVLESSERQAPGRTVFSVSAIPGVLNGLAILCRLDEED